jgi:hypothetical protein
MEHRDHQFRSSLPDHPTALVPQHVRALVLRWFALSFGVHRLVIALQMPAFGHRIRATECRKMAVMESFP